MEGYKRVSTKSLISYCNCMQPRCFIFAKLLLCTTTHLHIKNSAPPAAAPISERFRIARLRGCEVTRFEVRGCEVAKFEVARLWGSKFFIYRLMTFFWTALYVVMARLRGCEVARLRGWIISIIYDFDKWLKLQLPQHTLAAYILLLMMLLQMLTTVTK